MDAIDIGICIVGGILLLGGAALPFLVEYGTRHGLVKRGDE
jgi:hypothetical protein